MDVKGRINFPAKFREEIGARFLIAPWLDGCLIVVTEEKFSEMVDSYTAAQPIKGRNIARFLYSGATTVEPDKQGRVIIAQALREYAQIEKDVKVVGVGDRVEIWSADRWDALDASFDKDAMISILEEMGL